MSLAMAGCARVGTTSTAPDAHPFWGGTILDPVCGMWLSHEAAWDALSSWLKAWEDGTSMPEAVVKTVEAACKYEAERIVVGLPLNMDGSSGPMAEAVQVFVKKLGDEIDHPIETWDERMTSQEAERVLIEADVSRSKRKKVIDKMAAQAILQSWLDAHYTPL